jgi:hypothetical protein
MQLQHIKMILAATWVVAAVTAAITLDLTLITGIAIAVLAFLPPLALLLFWNEPAPTMSENIRNGRR